MKRRLFESADRVDRLPSDEHGHDGRLAGARGELQRQSGQIAGFACSFASVEMFQELSSGTEVGRDFGQPDHRLHGLDLAEEGADSR